MFDRMILANNIYTKRPNHELYFDFLAKSEKSINRAMRLLKIKLMKITKFHMNRIHVWKLWMLFSCSVVHGYVNPLTATVIECCQNVA